MRTFKKDIVSSTVGWYEFRQNNSGGDLVIDKQLGIGVSVWIQANDANQANEIANSLHITEGTGCPCCGDRWSYVSNSDKRSKVDIYRDIFWRKEYDGNLIYCHFLNGEIVEFNEDDVKSGEIYKLDWVTE